MLFRSIGTYNALEAGLSTLPTLERLVEFSTSEVFGQHAFNVNENQVTTIGPVGEARWTYAVSKLSGEHMAHAYHAELGVPAVSVRPFNVYGPAQMEGGAIRAFIEKALAGENLTIHGDGSQIRDFVYVDDAVEAFLAAGATDAVNGEAFNVGGEEHISHRDLVTMLVDLAGSGRYTFVEWPPEKKAIDIGSFYADSSLFRSRTGWTPRVALRDGFTRTFDYYRKHLQHYVGHGSV